MGVPCTGFVIMSVSVDAADQTNSSAQCAASATSNVVATGARPDTAASVVGVATLDWSAATGGQV